LNPFFGKNVLPKDTLYSQVRQAKKYYSIMCGLDVYFNGAVALEVTICDLKI